MANLGSKNGNYHVRFRYRGKEFKKSLKTRTAGEARAALHSVEQTLHRLYIGLLEVPQGVCPGDFIISGGTLREAKTTPSLPIELPTTRELMRDYLIAQQHLLAPSYHASQAIHFRHLDRYLGDLVDRPCDRVGFRDLDGYLKKRLAERHPNTVERERITILQFYKWLVRQGYLPASPAQGLLPIKGGE